MTRLAASPKTNGHAPNIERPEYSFDRLPTELKKNGKFVLWRTENGRKVPYCPHNPAEKAAINKPGSWADFDKTERAYDAFSTFDGINAVCRPEFTFLDIDHCVKTNISDAAQRIMAALPETYWEVSPSGTGLHGIFHSDGDIPNIGKQDGVEFELYSSKHFMSVTGWNLGDTRRIAKLTPAHLEQFRPRKTAKAKPNDAAPIREGRRTNTLLSVAGTMRRRGLDMEVIETAIRRHNETKCSPPLDDKKIASILKSVEKYQAAGDLLTQEQKDVGNADRLLKWGGGNFRFVAAFKRWAVYDGTRWPVEDREQETIRSEAHSMVRAFATQAVEAGDEKAIKFAADSLNSPKITSLLREAQPGATLHVAELDVNPLLVNFRNGTFDARTGQLREHRREDFITAVIPYDYVPSANAPKWEKFVAETFERDHEMIQFVQTALGYSLTGDTSAKCLFLANGPKDTAKTTLLAVVKKLLSDFAGRIQVQSLMVERGRPMDGNAQSDLADLRGKRFVMTSETGQGQRLREDLIKMLTQGQDEYRAVRKYENQISFRETWKIWMDCNHLPVIYGTDDAIWERLIVIPFNHRVPKAQQNRALSQQLIAEEAEGILAWIVRGLTRWQQRGLELPDGLKKSNERWKKESDDLGLWLEEDCVVNRGAKQGSSELYASYKFWREKVGFRSESIVLFTRKMKEHHFEKKEEGSDKKPHWLGVAIKK